MLSKRILPKAGAGRMINTVVKLRTVLMAFMDVIGFVFVRRSIFKKWLFFLLQPPRLFAASLNDLTVARDFHSVYHLESEEGVRPG